MADIDGWEGSSVVSHPLDHLAVDAGVAFLKEIGVKGTTNSLARTSKKLGAMHFLSRWSENMSSTRPAAMCMIVLKSGRRVSIWFEPARNRPIDRRCTPQLAATEQCAKKRRNFRRVATQRSKHQLRSQDLNNLSKSPEKLEASPDVVLQVVLSALERLDAEGRRQVVSQLQTLTGLTVSPPSQPSPPYEK